MSQNNSYYKMMNIHLHKDCDTQFYKYANNHFGIQQNKFLYMLIDMILNKHLHKFRYNQYMRSYTH